MFNWVRRIFSPKTVQDVALEITNPPENQERWRLEEFSPTSTGDFSLRAGQKVVFDYTKDGFIKTRVGEFDRFSENSGSILVYDYSVGGKPRWFTWDKISNFQLLQENF